jgi:tRNA (guanine-N7-)-methyltransferase
MTVRRSPRLPPEQLQPFLLEVSAPRPGEGEQPSAPLLDWQVVFGNANPVEVEVGCGKGLFLVTTAASNPQVNYLGIEIVRKYQLFTTTRIAKRNLTNVRVACADARDFLRDRLATGSVQAVHVYFPDPWWKKRHHKRRVFTDDFAAQVERVLRPGGNLLLATDVEDYAAMAREVMAAHTALRELPPPEEKAPEHDLDYLTNFERKARQKGKAVYRLRYERS